MPARERACRSCRRLTTKNVCENCGSSNLTSNFMGLIIIFDEERSEIAKELGLRNGAYAIRIT
ncbi:MAG: transcription elongation factor Spt4 [Nitrososphaeria archaeon]|nr:transcription elongation factor Spt4 [Aigarchaeota archaeon]MCX8187216.1 transcription elongation factor Spt4 [Nitrososphaeria archaeon]MDW8021697.1 transcription elongation factor subunit Spt4 [Nitrososphaerota archaeon]